MGIGAAGGAGEAGVVAVEEGVEMIWFGANPALTAAMANRLLLLFTILDPKCDNAVALWLLAVALLGVRRWHLS